jgi:hypothetical protein
MEIDLQTSAKWNVARPRVSTALLTATAGTLAIAAGPAFAQEMENPLDVEASSQLEIGVRSSIGVTDNVRRTPTNEESDTIATIGLVGTWRREEGRLTGEALADVSYYSYLNDTYDGRVIGGFNGNAQYALIPNRLTWMVRDSFGQVNVDPFVSSNPGNLQNTNYFTTGPDLLFRLGDRNDGRIWGRYSDVYYETTLGGNQRYEGGISIRRRLSTTTSMSIGASQERVDYYNVPPGSSFDRQEAYLGFGAQGQRTSINVRGGYTWLHDRGETSDGVLADVTLSRKIGGYSSLTLRGGRDFSDTGDVFQYGLDTGTPFSETKNAFDIADPFQRTHASISWNTTKARTEFSASAGWQDEDYETLNEFDRELRTLTLGLTHSLTELTRLSARVHRTQDEFDAGYDDDEWRYTVAYGWQVGRPLYVEFTFQRYDRESSLYSGSAIENQFFVSLTYTYSP